MVLEIFTVEPTVTEPQPTTTEIQLGVQNPKHLKTGFVVKWAEVLRRLALENIVLAAAMGLKKQPEATIDLATQVLPDHEVVALVNSIDFS